MFMCGIAGSIITKSNQKVNTELLHKMSDAIAERGPDGNGVSIINDGRVGLVHRRLAIVDLSQQARQPMSNCDDSIFIVFNGEIYNHTEIRKEINKIAGNIRWKTDHSDTEVIIHAYEVWGIRCIKKLRGMFAFALWDGKKKKMWLVRDRIGIKPLYYGIMDGKINFASNVRALLADDEQDRMVDKVAMYDFLSLLAVPAPNTMFKNIKKVPAGSYLEITIDGKLKNVCYWDICKYAGMTKLKESELCIKNKLLHKLRESVQLRKMADVPIGIFLSGGVDSSTNLALFAEDNIKTNTFTVGYKGVRSYRNENAEAKRIAGCCGAIHHDKILNEKDVLEFIDTLKKISDDPVADPVIVSQYYIAKLARENDIKVVQVGEGADELFAGYECWKRQAQIEKLNYIIPLKVKKALYGSELIRNRSFSENAEEILRRMGQGEATFWGAGGVYISEKRKNKLFNRKFMADIGNHKVWDNFAETYEKCQSSVLKETVGWMACINMKFRLPDLLLARTDKACMEVGVESRVPFLDHFLVEWGMRIPEKYKIKNGEHKHILKYAVRNLVPDSVIDKRKNGFGLPFMTWYKNELGKLINENVAYFADKSGYFEEKEVKKFMKDKSAQPFAIWAMFVLALWWQEYVEKKDIKLMNEGE